MKILKQDSQMFGGYFKIYPPYEKFYNFVETVLSVINETSNNDMKVVWLVGGKQIDSIPTYSLFTDYLDSVAIHFRNNSTLYAYDLMNEPAYFDVDQYTKSEVCSKVKSWYYALRENDPNHYVTIGLADYRDVFEWDPGILPIDFFSFHPYSGKLCDEDFSYNPAFERYKSKLLFLSDKIIYPWIIGETGLPACDTVDEPECRTDGIWADYYGSYLEQAEFAYNSALISRDCNSQGYTWWWYQDVHHSRDDEVCQGDTNTNLAPGNFYGLFVRNDSSTAKPAADTLYNFNWEATDTCPTKTSYYYNPFNLSNPLITITGTVISDDYLPVENAVIRAQENGPEWTILHTFSHGDGTFELRSNDTLNWVTIADLKSSVELLDFKIDADTNLGNIILEYTSLDDQVHANGVVVNSEEYEEIAAWRELTVQNTIIKDGGIADIYAAHQVKILPGFESNYGSNSHIYLDWPCSDIPVYDNMMKLDRLSAYGEHNQVTNTLKVFPNPNTGEFNLIAKYPFNRVEIINVYGNIVYSGETNFKETGTFDISSYPKGMYLLVVYIENQISTRKFLYQ